MSLVVNESGEVGFVTQELDHDELVAHVPWQGEQEGVELLEPLLHYVVSISRYHSCNSILKLGEMSA